MLYSTWAETAIFIEASRRDPLNPTHDPKIAFRQIAHAVDQHLIAPPIFRDLLGASPLGHISMAGVDNRGI